MSSSRGERGSLPKALFAAAMTTLAPILPAPASAASSLASYEVPGGCPARAVWTARLRERLPPPLRAHALIETLSVRVRTVGQGHAGSFSIGMDASLDTARQVRGETCDDVLDALAFAAALALERAADDVHAGSLAQASTSAGSDSPVSDAPVTRPAPMDAVAPRTATEDALTPSAVIFAQLQSGLTPGSALELGAAFRLAWSSASWQPLFLLGAYAGPSREIRVSGGGRLRFVHWSSQWIGCPWRFPRQGSFGLRPCLELEVGRSSGEAFDVADAAKYDATWVSGGAQLRAELVLGETWELGASLDGVIPFSHSHFYLVPSQTVFETPTFGLRAVASAGLIF